MLADSGCVGEQNFARADAGKLRLLCRWIFAADLFYRLPPAAENLKSSFRAAIGLYFLKESFA